MAGAKAEDLKYVGKQGMDVKGTQYPGLKAFAYELYVSNGNIYMIDLRGGILGKPRNTEKIDTNQRMGIFHRFIITEKGEMFSVYPPFTKFNMPSGVKSITHWSTGIGGRGREFLTFRGYDGQEYVFQGLRGDNQGGTLIPFQRSYLSHRKEKEYQITEILGQHNLPITGLE